MSDKLQRIKEQRTIEASKKGLMGFDGKLGCILRNLGQPVISHSENGGMFESSDFANFYDVDEDEEPDWNNPLTYLTNLPVIGVKNVLGQDIEEPTDSIWTRKQEAARFNQNVVGYYFDGLNRGMHLDIKYNEEEKELLVNHKGYKVYCEVCGDLTCYVPSNDWENQIDKLYGIAKVKEKDKRKVEKEARKQEVEERKISLLQMLKELWGL